MKKEKREKNLWKNNVKSLVKLPREVIKQTVLIVGGDSVCPVCS